MTGVTLLAAVLAFPAHAESGTSYDAPPTVETPGRIDGGQAAVLGAETDQLNDALNNPGVSRDELHGRAEALFGGMLRPEASKVPGVDLRGWEKPDTASSGDVDGMIEKSGDVIAAAKFKNTAEPPPAPELVDAWLYGRELKQNGMSGYDQDDKLGDGTLGAYLYTKTSALGILFNKRFREIQRWVGDQFAAATSVHEAAHARDHDHGQLNAKEVKKGEKQAFETEFKYLRLVDPTGQKLSYARVKLCSPSSMAPKFACDYVTHLAKISWFGEKGDWDGLVSSLGYQDRDHDPNDGHGHPAHD